jgi:hypothetical protein
MIGTMMIGIAHDKPAAAQSPKAELIPLRQAISSTDFNIGLRFGLDIAVVVPPISADMSRGLVLGGGWRVS